MKRSILVLGGVRSGKSSYAVKLAKNFGKNVTFVATATVMDKEMKERIKLHQANRPKTWKLIEEEKDIAAALTKVNKNTQVVLIDCLGLLISNLLADDLEDKKIEKMIKKIISAMKKSKQVIITVSNEVGSGIVPGNHLARRFRDLLGMTNQMIAKEADEVILMCSGIALKIKDT